eukprot:TRINITY_DN8710_c1_g1_i1.p2 TRINITY_DN8710_c1_g1~~TRINITY_DN8710_c1_g1_i1.p2  ORF type:complete len:131 (-),score=17.75 TRINITY_DN8710_c1_g1_i1:2-394(-)
MSIVQQSLGLGLGANVDREVVLASAIALVGVLYRLDAESWMNEDEAVHCSNLTHCALCGASSSVAGLGAAGEAGQRRLFSSSQFPEALLTVKICSPCVEWDRNQPGSSLDCFTFKTGERSHHTKILPTCV